jgi:RNA polymerase sigma-70 factor (ECF subfamily)
VEELDIVNGCKKEAPAAQQALYEQYLPYLLAIIRRFGIADALLPDLVQEIFVQVFLSIKRFDPQRGALKYWLKSIAIHRILNLLRQRMAQQQSPLHLDLVAENEISLPFQTLEAEYLLTLIAELPSGYRTVFNLHCIDGYNHHEISQMLNIDEASSRSQLSRAKQLLRKKILQLQKDDSYGF